MASTYWVITFTAVDKEMIAQYSFISRNVQSRGYLDLGSRGWTFMEFNNGGAKEKSTMHTYAVIGDLFKNAGFFGAPSLLEQTADSS